MEHVFQSHQTFEREELLTGFRLAQLEVYNWGTFNQHVWVMSPHSGTALLTGANASGKSTLVDGLLTLLVPYHRRTYNQASGTERHRERDERTYILGAWSKQKENATSHARPEYLRDKTSYSVLLAVFHNSQLKLDVTLAQVLRVQDEGIYKFFVVAPRKLSILEHFRLTGAPSELRKQLRVVGAEVYNEFAAYNRHFRQLVNVRSDKAFDLFNQIVSIKEIGGLNTFVREHMLEKTQAQARITQLRANFDNLTRSHDAILLAQKQLQILEPLINDANKYKEQQLRIDEAHQCMSLVPFYIANRKYSLLETAITTATQERTRRQEQVKVVNGRLENLKQQEIDLNVAIRNDQVGQQIARLKQQLEYRVVQQEGKQAEAKKYNALVRSLNLTEYRDEDTFYTSIQLAKVLLEEIIEQLEALKQERDTYMHQLTGVREVGRALQDEVVSLKQRKSQIPVQDIVIRSRLTADLQLAEEELPFIGELLRVRDTEHNWEAAIERLLHGYALQLLVPEQHYYRVSRLIEKTYLGRRLIYHRVAVGQRIPRNVSAPDKDMLYNKLEVKAGTPLSTWLFADIIDKYDYLCCEALGDFQQARRALTVQGQIKHSMVLHEKDDRKLLGDRTSYVLGWNNQEKVEMLERQLAEQMEILKVLQSTIKRIENEQGHKQTKKQQLQRLFEFESFAALDWRTDERFVLELRAQVQSLEEDSTLATLQDQLKEVKKQREGVEEEQNIINGEIATLTKDIKVQMHQQERCDQKRQEVSLDALILAFFEKEHGGKELTLETIDGEENVLTNFYSRRMNSVQGTVNLLGPQIVLRMQELRQTSAKIAQEVDASLETVNQYYQYYEQIKREDLPRHSKRFKELLNDNVIIDISSFQADLEQQEKKIEESIERLNLSLNKIDYTPLTYIELCCERTHDQQVREFKNELRACFPNILSQQRTPEANEASFQRIHALLQRFEQDQNWTQKVTDVRNWLDFSAQELYREDGKRKNYYSDSSGKSGGQKTKLAYTILASAIAYQYGLDQEDGRERTFRFVVVDEAFSKSDEMNARYAMELFKQLDLQLLVVTPLDKIHVIEPYISACHYVVNNEEENDSKVYNLSIEQYYQQKQAIQMGALASDYAD